MIRYLWAMLIYEFKHWRWIASYPSIARLHNKPWKLDKESRNRIYARWDAEWSAREPKRPNRRN